VLILLVVLLLAAAAAFGYYGRLSQAYRFTESCPPEAKIEDISRIAGDVARTTTTSGEIRYVTYSFSDVSCATCAFVAEYHTRTRKVLKTVQVTKYRKEWQETGWNYWLGMPEWGWVTVPYTSTELQNVEEQYEEQVWKLQSARSGLDLDRIRQSLGLE
jgi:hypothetical protein